MDTAAFLARVIPPGNYFAICWNPEPAAPDAKRRGFPTRFFREGETAQAAGLIKWADNKGFDVYHACASFLAAEPDGEDARGVVKFKGRRTQENAQRLRTFWIDLDVKRDGDKKAAGSCYPSAAAALAWLNGFRRAINLPRPNLAVQSGYGLHVYWVLEDALGAGAWAVQAGALKAAMLAHGFVGDSGITTDAARLLRPVGTRNHKALPAMPVEVIAQLSGGDVPNDTMLAALAPFVGQAPARPHVGAGAGAASTGSNVVALSGGRASTALATVTAPNMALAAQAGAQQRHPWSFARIAQMCQQTGRSLASHGAGDSYPLWYLGHLTLAHFCEDGAQFVHEIGRDDPRYTVAGTDAAVAQVSREVAAKGSGPAPCSHYDRANPGGCQGCPHQGRIRGPYELGNRDNDLPAGYRRHGGGLQFERYDPLAKSYHWSTFVVGDVADALVDEIPAGGRGLTFTYTREGRSYSVYSEVKKVLSDSGVLLRTFEGQGVHLQHQNLLTFGKFIMAWVDQLISTQGARAARVLPFGWALGAGGVTHGFSVAGQLYKADGSVEAAPGGDPQILSAYAAAGAPEPWRQAFDMVTKDRPDLAAIVAASFAAPLMRFTGQPGVTVSAWSRQSGVGKSAAMTVGQGVWSAQKQKCALLDTELSVIGKLSETRNMVCNWDEIRLGSAEGDRAKRFVDFLFMLTLGKEKGRLQQDTASREIREWQTLMVVAANRPLMDYVTSETEGTDAGALRVFEYAITVPQLKASATAANVIEQVRHNHGHAGVAYARWLAGNADRAKAVIEAIGTDLNARLDAEQSERFYLAAMSTMLAGARIATRLGIAAFDVPALEAFLIGVFRELREARVRNSLVTQQGYDLEQLLSQFVSDNLGRRLITDRFGAQGSPKVVVKWAPTDTKCVLQIGLDDGLMRVSRSSFLEWCRRRNLSGHDIIGAMQKAWDVVVARRVIGGGTHYSSGQSWIVDISIAQCPSLLAYLIDAPAPQQPAAAVQVLRTRPDQKVTP